jgi:hypothetical protein
LLGGAFPLGGRDRLFAQLVVLCHASLLVGCRFRVPGWDT